MYYIYLLHIQKKIIEHLLWAGPHVGPWRHIDEQHGQDSSSSKLPCNFLDLFVCDASLRNTMHY